jgi:hypothetical protein
MGRQQAQQPVPPPRPKLRTPPNRQGRPKPKSPQISDTIELNENDDNNSFFITSSDQNI